MKKSLILLGVSCLFLFGCGNNDNNDNANTTGEDQNQTTQQESASQTPESFRYLVSDQDMTMYNMNEGQYDTNSKKSKYEQVIEKAVPDAKINKVTENDDGTITIDFDPEYLQSENLSTSAQLNVFMDKIRYAIKENFPDLKGYYFNANGKPATLNNYGEVKDVVPNDFDTNNLYLPFNEHTQNQVNTNDNNTNNNNMNNK